MLLTETVGVALGALRANTLRSALTMLGIVIGIGAVIAMVALGNGAQAQVKERINRLGTTVLQVNPQRVNQGGINVGGSMAKLTVKDVAAIEDRAPHVVGVNFQQDRNLQVVWGRQNTNIQVTGTIPNFLDVRGFRVEAGRMFTAQEEVGRKKLAVLGSQALVNLNIPSPEDVIGTQIRIASRAFTVIGVLAEKGNTGMGDGDNQILVPFSTGRFELFGTDRINDIWTLASSEADMDLAMGEIEAALRRSHRLGVGRPDDFTIRNQADFLEVLNETTQTFGLLLAGIAAVSLVVGGIGIMNIMLVSVTERTREIGVRKALGATRANVLLQFLIEAVVLCILGGAVGIGAGVVGASQLAKSMGWAAVIDGQSILIAFGFASATGVIFGVWPARRAATMDPIVALRYE
ncbi:MAG TPA: ABC transporter permease [Gemmatimonadaceae bacterium]|nr:ABC transporter permease [Gemmatimonadaceae bacterium]